MPLKLDMFFNQCGREAYTKPERTNTGESRREGLLLSSFRTTQKTTSHSLRRGIGFTGLLCNKRPLDYTECCTAAHHYSSSGPRLAAPVSDNGVLIFVRLSYNVLRVVFRIGAWQKDWCMILKIKINKACEMNQILRWRISPSSAVLANHTYWDAV